MRAYVRPLGEPNRCLNVYASYDCAGAARDAAHKPRWYKLAFRRIYVIVHGGGKAKAINRRLAEAGLPPLTVTVGGLPKAPIAIVWSPLPSGSPTVPQNRPRHFYPGSTLGRLGRHRLLRLLSRMEVARPASTTASPARSPSRCTEWGVEAGDDPAFVSRLFAWVKKHPRCKMLVYYQDFGTTSSYRIQNYPTSLGVLKDRLTPGFSRPSRRVPRLPPPPSAARLAPTSPPLASAVERLQRGDARVAGQVDAAAVGDHRRVGALRVVEDAPAAAHHEAGGRFVGELGDVDDVADRRERADHLAAGGAAPAQAAVLGVERVDVAVEGADEDGRRAVLGVGDGRAGVGVAAGRVAPGELAVAGLEAVDAAVVVAGVDAAEGDRGGRVEGARGAEARARASRSARPACRSWRRPRSCSRRSRRRRACRRSRPAPP